jgi:LysR family transcriptional regulator, transcription activator of glutamate synthase operon
MDWHQLKYFQTLANAGSFTKASEELVLSQPALSRSISRLEEEVGIPLFERKSRGVALNRYGEIFLLHANKALAEIAEAKQEINDMIHPNQGTVFLAFIETLGFSFVPDLISKFRKIAPQVKFHLSQDTTVNILELLDAGKIDIGFCSPQVTLEEIGSFPIVREELFLIVPISHPFAGRDQIDLAEAANEPFVLFKKETALHDVIETLCHEAGFNPKMSFESYEEQTIAGLVGVNFGVALVPRIHGLDKRKISIIRVSQPKCFREIKMVWRKNGYLSPVAAQFKDFVERDIRQSKRE